MPPAPACSRRVARRTRVAPALLLVAVAAASCTLPGATGDEASPTSAVVVAADRDRPVSTAPPTAPLPDTRDVELAPVVGAPAGVAPVEIDGGDATLSGSLAFGGEAVTGATVRLERWIEGRSTSIDLETGPGGGWSAPGIQGGRYVIRAWKGNRLVLAQASAVFIGEDEERAVHLAMVEVLVPEDEDTEETDEDAEDEDAEEIDEDAEEIAEDADPEITEDDTDGDGDGGDGNDEGGG